MTDNTFNEQHRFGSASWASGFDLAKAGLTGNSGLFIGYKDNQQLRIDSDAPMITFGGAGSGKTRDLLGYVVCTSPGLPMLILDPRGELERISRIQHTLNGEYAYRWNPTGMLGTGGHACNLLDILTLNSPSFHSDTKFIAEGLITLSGGGSSRYFEQSARRYAEAILKSDVEQDGYTSFPRFYRTVSAIESDPHTWGTTLEAMLNSQFQDVRRVAGEMIAKQNESPKEFGSIIAELYNNTNFLSDPALIASLKDKRDREYGNQVTFSLAELCRTDPVRKIFLNIPAECLSIWSPVIRVFFTVAMLYKTRNPQARRILLLVDEAGQLGKFEALMRAVTFGRGGGIKAWSIWQGIGQVQRSFSPQEFQTFMGSCQVRQFFGVRDYETAKLISDMLGQESLQYDDTLAQSRARKSRMDVMQKAMSGQDPFTLGHELAHHKMAQNHRSTQARALMTPEEILSMPEDRQILFVSGLNLKPTYGEKYPYYTCREMAKYQYLPNPYHPPTDSVRVQGMFGAKYIPVITEPVPEKYALYPQHSDGTWSYCAS